MPSPGQRASVLLVHDDSELLDLLTTHFEASDFEVAIGATSFAAMRFLQSNREFGAIVVGWNLPGDLALEMYHWALTNKYVLRSQFVFLAEETPENFADIVQGRCLCLRPTDIEEIVRVASAAAARLKNMLDSHISEVELQWVDADTPTLLLVDDEPVLLSTMVRLLRDVGLDVIPAESGNHAISVLENQPEIHVVLSDWYMFDGNGYDLYAWIQKHRPELAESCVFMSAGSPENFKELAPGRRLVPKGQDSPYLVSLLIAAAKRTKALLGK